MLRILFGNNEKTKEKFSFYRPLLEKRLNQLKALQTPIPDNLYQSLIQYETASPGKLNRFVSSRQQIADGKSGLLASVFIKENLTSTKVNNISRPLRQCLEVYSSIDVEEEGSPNEEFIKATVDLNLILFLMNRLSIAAQDKNEKTKGDLNDIIRSIRANLIEINTIFLRVNIDNSEFFTRYIKPKVMALFHFYYMNIQFPAEQLKDEVAMTLEVFKETLGHAFDKFVNGLSDDILREMRKAKIQRGLVDQEKVLKNKVIEKVEEFTSTYQHTKAESKKKSWRIF